MVIVTYELNRDYESEAQSAGLVNYVLNHERRAYDTPLRRGGMFDYLLAADGLYLHAKREELEICLQVAPAEVRGLEGCFEKFAFGLPKVPNNLVKEILYISTSYAQDSKERLFWLEHSPHNTYDNGWSICHPLQMSSASSCRPIEGQDEAYQRAIIVIHSHHSKPAQFSRMDNRNVTGFRLYRVLEQLTKKSEIRLRVDCYSYF